MSEVNSIKLTVDTSKTSMINDLERHVSCLAVHDSQQAQPYASQLAFALDLLGCRSPQI